MVINTNITSTANSPLLNTPATSNTKPRPSQNLAAQDNLATFYSQDGDGAVNAASDLVDPNDTAITGRVQSLINNIMQQPGQAMLAQANLSPESVLRLLQD